MFVCIANTFNFDTFKYIFTLNAGLLLAMDCFYTGVLLLLLK